MNWQGAVMKSKNLKSLVKSVASAAAIAAFAGGYAYAADMPLKNPPPPKPVPFFFVNDTSVSFTYFPSATDPGVAGSSGSVIGGIAGQKNTFGRYSSEIDHFDVWEYGTNLIHAEYNFYGDQDPVLGSPGAQGNREFYGFFRSTIGLNEVTHSKMFSSFLFTDVGLEVGGNADIQDDFLSSQDTSYVAGLNFNLNLPGTVLVSILAYKDYAHNNFDTCNTGFGFSGLGGFFSPVCTGGAGVAPIDGDRYFKWAPKIETFISEPIKFFGDGVPLTFINIANVTFPKGTGLSSAETFQLGGATAAGQAANLANEESKTEVFEDARLSLDTSKVFWGKPGIWDTYVGYRYWYNKFGTDHNAPLFSVIAPGTSIESSVYVGTTYHFK
jgi:hypothetical protein